MSNHQKITYVCGHEKADGGTATDDEKYAIVRTARDMWVCCKPWAEPGDRVARRGARNTQY